MTRRGSIALVLPWDGDEPIAVLTRGESLAQAECPECRLPGTHAGGCPEDDPEPEDGEED